MFPSLHLLVKYVQGDGKIIIIDTSNCWTSLYQKPSSKASMLIKHVKSNTDRDVKHISCIFISIFSFTQNKGAVTLPPNHVVEHHIVRTDIEDRKVLLEETAVAHVNPL